MAEKLSDTIAKIKSNATKFSDREYAKAQLDFDALFEEHSKKILPGFKSCETIEKLKLYFLTLANGEATKGLYVYGNVGVGKSTIFQIIRSMGRSLYDEYGSHKLWFTECTAPWLVNEKMKSVSQAYKGNFEMEKYNRGKLYIDDLGMETLCFNNYELLGKLLFQRHRNGAITFVSSNLSPKNILDRYGPQIFDRMGEMFHIVKWEGQSLRP